jgi:hypothetical protein
MFFNTLPKPTRKMFFNIRALSIFRYSACFAARGVSQVLQISASYLKSDLNFPRCLRIFLLQNGKSDNNAIAAIYNLKLRKP